MVSQDAAEVHRSAAELAVLAHPAAVCAELARIVPARDGAPPAPFARPAPPAPPAAGEPLRAGHVFAALAERLPRNAVVIEESPSNRPELLVRLPAREPLGSLSPAMGGLGFALPAATGLRMARPDRPVVAIVGDGSSLYAIQALWSAAHYRAGALFVILSNGGYAIMDRLVEQHGGTAPWPGFGVDVAGLARAFGCPARNVAEHGELLEALDEVRAGPRGPRRAAPPRGRGGPRRELRPVTQRFTSRAQGCERAGRLRDPALRLGPRPRARASASGPSRSSPPSSESAARPSAKGCGCSRARTSSGRPRDRVAASSSRARRTRGWAATSASRSRRCWRPTASRCTSCSKRASISRCRSPDSPRRTRPRRPRRISGRRSPKPRGTIPPPRRSGSRTRASTA